MSKPLRLFVDFDGTISTEDTTDLLLERFADPAWIEAEAAWQRGEIGSRECMARQVELLRMTPVELESFLEGIPVDPGFAGFMDLCRQEGLAVTVLSDGLDRVAKGVLRRFDIDIPVLSNRIQWQGGDRWRLDFPNAVLDCSSGTCKCGQLGRGRGAECDDGRVLSALIGDGRSDFCGAATADAVFAKGKLAAHCREQAIPHTAFDGFEDLTPQFRSWLDMAFPMPHLAGEVDARLRIA